MASRSWRLAQLPAALLAIGLGHAEAHPHVWADMRSQLLVSDEGLITGVRVQWTTDKTYALDALNGFKKNPDGSYDPAELAKLTQENLSALSDYGYFIFFRFNGEPQKIGKAQDGMQTYDKAQGRLTLLFTVPLQTPLDPHKGTVQLKVYDPEFFIDFEYVEDKPLLISQKLPSGCNAKLLAVPKDAGLDQTKQMLSTKGRDWKPENNEDFGSMFAQAAEVSCGG
ncbi:MAG: DUF1007 family protein [Alphaproteobacteria bacterium]|nr:DUF1007 family protein [Alphaproteobacteria bacterium]